MNPSISQIICGDCLEEMRKLPSESVDCCITSPPYFGLRDYQVDGQIGLEASPEAYVAQLVDVFREVKRVLKPEGTLWLNLGDSYSSLLRSGRKESPGVGAKQEMSKVHTNVKWHAGDGSKFQWTLPGGQKLKDLIGIPWMVAFALRADGWYLRSDIIWHKPNCMPESVTDRPTKSHEYLFLLSKSQGYYYDAEAIKEECVPYEVERRLREEKQHLVSRYDLKCEGQAHAPSLKSGMRSNERKADYVKSGRNKRTVWTIPTKPFPQAHFATFPEKLVEPCVLAGTSERGYCPACGKPWVRQVERNNPSKAFNTGEDERYSSLNNMGGNHQTVAGLHRNGGGVYSTAKTIGWLPSCQCASEPRPGIVLDPFSGAGTVALVAKKLGRHYIGIELNPSYVEMSKARISKIPDRLDAFVFAKVNA